MDIIIHSPNVDTQGIELEEDLGRALSRFAPRLTRVEVFLKDTNAAKGGIDKSCVIEARPRGLDPVAVEHRADGVADAVVGATGKIQRHLDHLFGKLGNVHPHQG